MRAPAKQLQQPRSGEAHIYVHNRPFTSFCNNKRLPKAVIHAAVEAGVCHFQIYVSLPEGKILTYDFGPVGGRDTTLRSDDKRGTPAEIREHVVDAVPAGALRVASVQNMTHEAIRAYNAQQPTYYKLHKSDCRHYCNKFVSHFAGKRTNATVQLLRAQYQARVLKERAQLLHLLQQNGSHLPPLDLGPLLKRGQRITGSQQQQQQLSAAVSESAHVLLDAPAPALAHAQLSSSNTPHASSLGDAAAQPLHPTHHAQPHHLPTNTQHSVTLSTVSTSPTHGSQLGNPSSPTPTTHTATTQPTHTAHATPHIHPHAHSSLPPDPNPLATDTRFQLFSWHTLAQLATGSAQPFLVPNLTPHPPSPSSTDPHMSFSGHHPHFQSPHGLPHLTMSTGYEWYQSKGVAGYNPHSPSGAAALLLPLLSRLPPWHAPVFSTLQWLTDCENWEQLEQLQKVGATAATAFGGKAFAPHMHSLLRLPLDFSMARLPAALAAAASLAKLPRFAGLARLPTAGASFVRLPRAARRAVAGRAASLRGIKGAPARGGHHSHSQAMNGSTSASSSSSRAANSGSSTSSSSGAFTSSSGGSSAAVGGGNGSWLQQNSGGQGLHGPGSWGGATASAAGQGAASAAPATSFGTSPSFAPPAPSLAAHHTHTTPIHSRRPPIAGMIWHPARRLARTGARTLWGVRARARARMQPQLQQQQQQGVASGTAVTTTTTTTTTTTSNGAPTAGWPASSQSLLLPQLPQQHHHLPQQLPQQQQQPGLSSASALASGLPLLTLAPPAAGAAAAAGAKAGLGAAGAAGAAGVAGAAPAAAAAAAALAAALAAAPQLQQKQQKEERRHEQGVPQEADTHSGSGARGASMGATSSPLQCASPITTSPSLPANNHHTHQHHQQHQLPSSTAAPPSSAFIASSRPSLPHLSSNSSSSSSSTQRLPLHAQVGMLMGGLALLNRHTSGLGELARHLGRQRQRQPQPQQQAHAHPQALQNTQQLQQQQQQVRQQQVQQQAAQEVRDEAQDGRASGKSARAWRHQRVAFLPPRVLHHSTVNSGSSDSSSSGSGSGSGSGSCVRGWVWNGGEGAHAKGGAGLLRTAAVGQPQLAQGGVEHKHSSSSSGNSTNSNRGGGKGTTHKGGSIAEVFARDKREARDSDGPPAAAAAAGVGVRLLPLQLHPHQSQHPLAALARAVGTAARKHAMRSLL